MAERLVVEVVGTLLPTLQQHFDSWRTSTLRDSLRAGAVEVNGVAVQRADHPLQPGDAVDVLDGPRLGSKVGAGGKSGAGGKVGAGGRGGASKIVVLYRDDDIVAIDKPAGLLAVSAGRETSDTALALVRALLGPKERLWPVNRLDRETSGVMLFARSHEMREATQAHWGSADKRYLAVVDGKLERIAPVVDQPLWEDDGLFVRVGGGAGARPARTEFAIVRISAKRTLLDVALDSGRKHQIRVHLAWLGHPIVGDDRYGSGGGRGSERLGLHALRLSVRHPRTGRLITFEAPPPPAFEALMN